MSPLEMQQLWSEVKHKQGEPGSDVIAPPLPSPLLPPPLTDTGATIAGLSNGHSNGLGMSGSERLPTPDNHFTVQYLTSNPV